MPAEVFGSKHKFLPRPELLSFEEITRLARVFVALGVTKLRLTGGEPLLRRHLNSLVGMLRRLAPSADIALTTNGLLLPRFAAGLRKAGLDRLTVSLDALDEDLFKSINGREVGVGPVLAGIAAAEAAGFESVKVNVVVQRGLNEGEILSMAEHFRGTPHVVRFIEFMDVGNTNGWCMDRVVTAEEILSQITARYPLEALPPRHPGETARRYRYADGAGEIGVIASVTRPFCRGCSRGRLSARGELFSCLFASGGLDLRDPLRSGVTDDALAALITDRWGGRTDRYSEDRTAGRPTGKRVEMSYIGG